MHPALVVIDMQKRFIPGPRRLFPALDEAFEIINDAPRFVERISPLMSYEVAVALAALPRRSTP